MEDFRDFLNDVTAIWNAHDIQKLVDLWVPEGIFISVNGEKTVSKKEIRQATIRDHEGPLKAAQIKIRIVHSTRLTSDLYLLNLDEDLDGLLDTSGRVIPRLLVQIVAVVRKVEGEWKFVYIQGTIPTKVTL
jgi:uncharacterized protein (TIGR02246 family)